MLFLISRIIVSDFGSIGSVFIEKDDSRSTMFKVSVSEWISLFKFLILYSKIYDCGSDFKCSCGVR